MVNPSFFFKYQFYWKGRVNLGVDIYFTVWTIEIVTVNFVNQLFLFVLFFYKILKKIY